MLPNSKKPTFSSWPCVTCKHCAIKTNWAPVVINRMRNASRLASVTVPPKSHTFWVLWIRIHPFMCWNIWTVALIASKRPPVNQHNSQPPDLHQLRPFRHRLIAQCHQPQPPLGFPRPAKWDHHHQQLASHPCSIASVNIHIRQWPWPPPPTTPTASNFVNHHRPMCTWWTHRRASTHRQCHQISKSTICLCGDRGKHAQTLNHSTQHNIFHQTHTTHNQLEIYIHKYYIAMRTNKDQFERIRAEFAFHTKRFSIYVNPKSTLPIDVISTNNNNKKSQNANQTKNLVISVTLYYLVFSNPYIILYRSDIISGNTIYC